MKKARLSRKHLNYLRSLKRARQARRAREGRGGGVVYIHTRSLPERVAAVAVWWCLVASVVTIVVMCKAL